MRNSESLEVPKELKPFVIHRVSSRFEKVREIGSGAQARVYLAKDLETGQRVALKELNEHPEHRSTQARRFISEVTTSFRCSSHPFLLHLVGFTTKRPLTIVSEYVSSVTLTVFLSERKYEALSDSGTTLTKIAIAIASAMKFMHKIGIIHRDLKPGNIVLDGKYLPKILDFGLVREYSRATPQTYQIGTPNWMAPEVILGEDYTEKCDVYSFAMILYEMGTKQRPLAGCDGEKVIYLYAKKHYRPEFPAESMITRELRELIERCWSDDPDERPSFREIFKEFANGDVMFDGCNEKEISRFVDYVIDKEADAQEESRHGKKRRWSYDSRDASESEYRVKTKQHGRKRMVEDDSSSDERVFRRKKIFDTDEEDISLVTPKGLPFQKEKAPAPEFRARSTMVSRKPNARDAPKMRTLSLQLSSSESSEPASDKEDRDKYQPLASPHYSTRINYSILMDSSHPLFKDELQKVSKRNANKFFGIVFDYLKSRSDTEMLNLLLRKCAEIIDEEDVSLQFCERGIFRCLPFDDAGCLDAVCDVLERVFKFTPQYFQSNFEYGMVALITARPARAITLLTTYGYSFDTIENPWPMMDLLIKHRRKFERGNVGYEAVSLLSHMLRSFKTYRDSRMDDSRPVLVWFTTSKDKKTAIAAYKAITRLYDEKFDLDYITIQNDILDPDLTTFVVDLLMRVKELPIVPELVFPVLRAARVNPKAGDVMQKMLAKREAVCLLIDHPKFLRYKLPTYVDTMQMLLQMTAFRDLRSAIAACSEVPILLSLSVEDKTSAVFCLYEKILSKLPFDRSFLEALQENNFFVSFFQGIVEIDDCQTTISCLKALSIFSSIGYCSEYKLFGDFLKKLIKCNDPDLSEAALAAVSELSFHRKMAILFDDLAIPRLAKEFNHGHARQYVKDIVNNCSAVHASDSRRHKERRSGR